MPPPKPDGSWDYYYFGHPNAARGEFVLDGGNPTPGRDSVEVTDYPVGTQPDEAWAGYVHRFGPHVSPNGIIEYQNDAFGGALKGKIIVLRFNVGDAAVLEANPADGSILEAADEMTGLSGFVKPLDLAENPSSGDIYVTEFGKEGRITLLRPAGRQVASARVP
jgi:hypothetical protein